MGSPPTPTTGASPRVYRPRLMSDGSSTASSTTDEFFDADSFIFTLGSGSGHWSSIPSYKTVRSINSRKSRYNALPRRKYADIGRLPLLRGPVSPDVDGASALKAELMEFDEARNILKRAERDTTEHKATIDDIIKTAERLSFDDTNVASSTTDEFFDAESFIFSLSSGSGPSSSIPSYKTVRSINSRKSRYNVLPRRKYAGIGHLRPPRGPVSSDVDGASAIKTELRDKPDEATMTIKTAERDVVTAVQ